MSERGQVFVARQPIVDREQRVVAYELLFRASAEASSAGPIADSSRLALRTIIDTFMRMGSDKLLGPHHGYFNVSAEVLESEYVEALPADRVVLEILESATVTSQLIARCAELRKAGFTLALDDYVPDDSREEMLDVVDVVKVDLRQVSSKDLPGFVRSLRKAKVRLLAEKVELPEEFEACRKLGFHLFQGYHFARPSTVEARSVDPERSALLQLYRSVAADAEVGVLAEHLKRHPGLGMNLLRLVNSVGLARTNAIATVEHAVVVLGRKQLRRWLMLLLFAGVGAEGLASPLLQTAAVRGRLMELLTLRDATDPDTREQGERAFLVGMLSLAEAALGILPEQLAVELSLDEEVRSALVECDGSLGELLQLVTSIEEGAFEGVAARSAELAIDPDRLMRAEAAAWSWAAELSG